jgi:hypothetical protein
VVAEVQPRQARLLALAGLVELVLSFQSPQGARRALVVAVAVAVQAPMQLRLPVEQPLRVAVTAAVAGVAVTATPLMQTAAMALKALSLLSIGLTQPARSIG